MYKFIYATTKELKGIVIKKQNSEIKILENVSIPLEEGAFINGKITKKEEFVDALELLKVSSDSFKKNVIFLLDNSSIVFKKVELPTKYKTKDLYNLSELEFADITDSSKEQVYYTSVINSKHKKFGLCTAIERSILSNIQECFQEAAIKLMKVDLLPLVIINYLQNTDMITNKNYVLSILEDNFVTSFIFEDSDFSFVSRARILAEPGEPDFINELYRNLNSLLEFNLIEHNNQIEEIFYFGISEMEYHSLKEMLNNNLPFNILNLNVSLFSEDMDKDSIPCVVLLYDEYGENTLLQLIENKESLRMKKRRQRIVVESILAGCVLLFTTYGGLKMYEVKLNKEIENIKQQLQSEEHVKAYANAFIYQNVNTTLLERQSNFNSFEEYCNSVDTDVDYYNKIIHVLNKYKIEIISLQCNPAVYTLTGNCNNENIPSQVASELHALKTFYKVSYTNRSAQNGKVTFSMDIIAKRQEEKTETTTQKIQESKETEVNGRE